MAHRLQCAPTTQLARAPDTERVCRPTSGRTDRDEAGFSSYELFLKRDQRQLRLIRASFVASDGIYGAPRVFLDLREAGETCSKHRVARLMRQANVRALHGYRIRRWTVGKPSVLIPNLLKRRFTAMKANAAWVTDITYICTWQGWLYLAVVMDLFSRLQP